MTSYDDFILPFTDERATDPARTGGKGASLSRLTRAGFPVPEGAVVAAAAYRAFIADWTELPGLVAALDLEAPDALRGQCAAIRSALVARPFPAPLESALRERLGPLVEAGAVSVRSSATLEDLAGAAFAGQHDTFLGVRGVDAALESIRRCYASLWEDRAVRYRHEHGFRPDAADMAVVVQRMVAADVAGVAFSLDPITGETDRVLITASYGLGETVVSGEGEVDTYRVDREAGAVLERRLGAKSHALVQTAEGTERVELDAERGEGSSLSDDQARAVAELAAAAERHYAFPQDVEWAIDGSGLHLLQSRPITEYPARWTRQESAERFPAPITPLTWDFTTEGFHESLAYSLALMGMPPFRGKWFERLDGYIYGNQTAVEVFTAGHQVAFESLEELVERGPELRDRYRWVQELPVRWARDLDRYLIALGRLEAVDLAGLDLPDLWAHVLEVDRVGREYFLPNIAISITQGLLHRMVFRLVALVVGAEAAPGTYDALTGFAETKTGLVNRDLYALYRSARSDEGLAALLVERDRRAIIEDGELAAHPDFQGAFRRFLEDHGHREVDFDAYHPTWAGQPWVVLENLRLMLLRGDVPDPAEQELELRARQHAAERTFLAAVPESLRTLASELLRLARAYTALDDLEHYQTTRLSIPFRAALVEVGTRLVDRGVAEAPEDVFFLHRSTLDGLMAGATPDAEAAAEVAENRAAYRAQRETDPPFRHGEELEEPTEDDLRGLPGSPGTASGPVILVRSSDDFGRFQPGAVLVARTTNPAWTPLFYAAAAVVTESGGPLSHGAVTAREVGIPAVVSVRGALRLLEDGDRVRVNGTTGAVARLEPDEG